MLASDDIQLASQCIFHKLQSFFASCMEAIFKLHQRICRFWPFICIGCSLSFLFKKKKKKSNGGTKYYLYEKTKKKNHRRSYFCSAWPLFYRNSDSAWCIVRPSLSSSALNTRSEPAKKEENSGVGWHQMSQVPNSNRLRGYSHSSRPCLTPADHRTSLQKPGGKKTQKQKQKYKLK